MPRLFTVIVPHKPRPVRYPPMDSERTYRLMRTLSDRGLDAIAETESNGIRESLTFAEMRDTFADWYD